MLSRGGKASFSKVDWFLLASCGFGEKGKTERKVAEWLRSCKPGVWGGANRGGGATSGSAAGLMGGVGGSGGQPAPSSASPKPIGVAGEPPHPSVGASQLRLGREEKLRWPRFSHGRSRLRHQGHVPLQADLGAEPHRCAQGHEHWHLPARLLTASRHLALQGLAAGRGRLP